MQKIIRLPEVKQITGLSSSSIWRKEQNGKFPKRKKLGIRAVGWLLDDIENWVKKISSGNSDV